jgi:hypothetical protein
MTWKDKALQAADTKAAREREAQRVRDEQEEGVSELWICYLLTEQYHCE